MSLSIYPHFMVGRMPSNQVVPFLLAIFVISAPKSRQSTYLYLSLWNPRGSANQAFLRQWQLQLHCCNWSCEAGAAQGRTYMYTWYVHTLYNVVYQLFYLLYCKLYILTLYVNYIDTFYIHVIMLTLNISCIKSHLTYIYICICVCCLFKKHICNV